NPYSQIVTRNIFGLNPPVVETNPPDNTLIKISPNGIQNFLGTVKVLFKTTGGKKEQFYALAENQGQDGITVQKIDQKNGIITFDNHGTVQTLPLTEPTGGGAAATTANPAGGQGNFNPQGGNNENGNPNRFSQFGRRGGGFNGRGNNANGGGSSDNSGDSNLRTVPTRVYQPEASTMTPDEAAIKLEQNYAAAADAGDPAAKLYPPSPLRGK